MRAGFEPITVHDQAVAFSAALETEGLLDAPAGDQRVAKLYHETVGVHLAARIEAKKVDGLVFNVQTGAHGAWSRGECVVTSEADARKFSDALRANKLLDARSGDPRVQSTARKSRLTGTASPRCAHLIRWFPQVKKLFDWLFLAPMLSAKAQPGLIVIHNSIMHRNCFWYRDDIYVKSMTAAKAFSEALVDAKLLDAPAGDPRIRQVFDETFPELAQYNFGGRSWETKQKLAASKKLVEDFNARAADATLPSPVSAPIASGTVVAPLRAPPRTVVTQSLSADSAGPAGDGGGFDGSDPPPVAAFVRTLYEIAHGDPTENLCEWSESGERIIFRDPEKFGESVCPRFFRHSKWTSFYANLLNYQFQRFATEKRGTKNAIQTFEHHGFRRGRQDLLHLIKKKPKKPKAPKVAAPAVAASPTESAAKAPEAVAEQLDEAVAAARRAVHAQDGHEAALRALAEVVKAAFEVVPTSASVWRDVGQAAALLRSKALPKHSKDPKGYHRVDDLVRNHITKRLPDKKLPKVGACASGVAAAPPPPRASGAIKQKRKAPPPSEKPLAPIFRRKPTQPPRDDPGPSPSAAPSAPPPAATAPRRSFAAAALFTEPSRAAPPRTAPPHTELARAAPPPPRAEQPSLAKVTVKKRRRIVESDDEDESLLPSPEAHPSKMRRVSPPTVTDEATPDAPDPRVSPTMMADLVQLAREDPDAFEALCAAVRRKAQS